MVVALLCERCVQSAVAASNAIRRKLHNELVEVKGNVSVGPGPQEIQDRRIVYELRCSSSCVWCLGPATAWSSNSVFQAITAVVYLELPDVQRLP